MQVLLILVSELQPSDALEKMELLKALSKAVVELNLEREAAQEVAGQRTPQHEVQLLIMKFFGFLLSTHKTKSQTKRQTSRLLSHLIKDLHIRFQFTAEKSKLLDSKF